MTDEQQLPPKSIRVLIADDSESMRLAVRDEMLSMGYNNIVLCGDGVEAMGKLKAAETTAKPFELVLIDWRMPNLTGLEFLRICRTPPSKFINLPIILITSEGRVNEVLKAVTWSVSAYLIKPLKAGALKEKLLQAWARHKNYT